MFLNHNWSKICGEIFCPNNQWNDLSSMKYTLLLFSLLQFFPSFGIVKPAKLFSDNMVLQRDAPIPVWGTANPEEKIIVKLESSEMKITAKPDGTWMVYLPKHAAGGPFQLVIEGQNRISFSNVLIGDVWFASGQSNMEHPVNGWDRIPYSAINNSKEAIADSKYPEIRLFSVPKYPSPVELKDLSAGKWEMANPESVAGFSAIGWFFAKELHQKLKVPIGIIHSSWGGTPIQTWMSRESLEAFKDSVKLPPVPASFDQNVWTKKITSSLEKTRMRRMQISYPPKDLPWLVAQRVLRDATWKTVNILEKDNHFGNVVWLRRKLDIPATNSRQPLQLSLGYQTWQSQIFLNGKEIGYFQYPKPVIVKLPQNFVRTGENILTIRIAQPWVDAQCFGRSEQFFLSNSDRSFYCDLSKDWQANSSLESIIGKVEEYQNNPAFLYNGMVAPCMPYGMKGIIWYQGESDAGRPLLYKQQFQKLITDWRASWKNKDMSFLFFQVSTFPQSHESAKKEDPWKKLREAQQAACTLPKTGMVMTIDIGDQLDIHPKNKQEFAHRLVMKLP